MAFQVVCWLVLEMVSHNRMRRSHPSCGKRAALARHLLTTKCCRLCCHPQLLAARIMIEDCMCLLLDVLDIDQIFVATAGGALA